MSATAPTLIRPSSRFYAAFHRYLTTTIRTAHITRPRHPHPSPSPSLSTSNLPHHQITRYYATTSPSNTSHPPHPPQTFYTLFPHTLPRGPPPLSPFTPDLRALRQEYLRLQSSSHPDKHPSGPEKVHAEARSALINEAYRTLTSPLKRAEYLLGLRGVDVGEGVGVSMGEEDEDEFLEEVMEVRGEVDAAKEEGELEGMRRGNEERIAQCVAGLERGFEELGMVERRGGDRGEEERLVRALVRETVRLRYWIGVREGIDGWEEGKGGGRLEH